ncbi:tetratricopeptide repeat protein [Methylophaga sp. OBS3]|uniref:tetratricopeptide repeat protein n=1 Tax=Methylophaga sp. OBS3 TaxID=2991934 RepID=UPI00224F2015|nr:tetratricopeptide repeat protein [Methylophaga sp. OBS3]MCX4190661.1 tetratricopeptide repeat protein [Methylophaga sp. OBS3]
MKKLLIVTIAIFLTACGPRKFSVNDSYIDIASTAKAYQQTNAPDNGFYYTRTVGNIAKPNKPWSGHVTTEGTSLYIMDFGFELKQETFGNYYRVHIYPHYQVPMNTFSPWIEITFNRNSDDDDNPLMFYAKLPENKSSTDSFVTEWFSCDTCNQARELDIQNAANKASETTDRVWYRFVSTPANTPGWQGHIAARESTLQSEAQKKQRELEQLEASLPPSVLRDKYMVQLSNHLKQQQYQEAIPLFAKLAALPGKSDPSLKFFYGEALLKTGQPAEALSKLYSYIGEQGTSATHYSRALELINQAESQLQ